MNGPSGLEKNNKMEDFASQQEAHRLSGIATHPLRLERLRALQSLELEVTLRSHLGAVNGRLLSHHHLAVQHKTLRQSASSVEHFAYAVFSRRVVSAPPAAEQLAKEGIPSIRGPVLAFLAPGSIALILGMRG
jgi:hypothetical protein